MANHVPPRELEHCLRVDPASVPRKPPSNEPSVRAGNSWGPTLQYSKLWITGGDVDWGVCRAHDSANGDSNAVEDIHRFARDHTEGGFRPETKTSRCYRFWIGPQRLIKSERYREQCAECQGSYTAPPSSMHAEGVPCPSETAPNGTVSNMDLKGLLGVGHGDALKPLGHHVSGSVQMMFNGWFITRSPAVQLGAQVDDEDVQVRGQNMTPGNN